MVSTIQPINPAQNVQMVNPSQDRPPQPKLSERTEPTLNGRPERSEARTALSLKRVETNPLEDNQQRDNPAVKNTEPQEVQNSQGNEQLGKTLDIMA